MLHQILRQAGIVFGITIPLWLVFRLMVQLYLKSRGDSLSFKRECFIFLFQVYVTCVLMATVMPLPMTRDERPRYNHINIIPVVNTGKQLQATIVHGTHGMLIHSLENVIGNVILFFPLGLSLPLLWPGYWPARRTILVAIAFSIFIELTQLVERKFGIYRSVDVDDVLLNTLGAVLGIIVAGLIMPKKPKPASVQ